MNKTPFISIVTVVYNGEKTIRKTIESVLCQDFKDYEYIIVDGLSKDNTVSLAKEYETCFEGRLRIYSEKDRGIYDAMNKGIKLAKGDYIWLVNADDWIEPNALADIQQSAKKSMNHNAIIAGWINVVSADGGDLIRIGQCSEEGYKKACKKLGMGLCHPAAIVPRVVYETVGLYDDRYYISADMDFVLRCYRSNIPVKFLPKPLSNMARGGISSMFPVKKNLHDIWLRACKFKSNVFSRCFYMILATLKFFIIKMRGGYL